MPVATNTLRPASHRAAFTLLELILVLSLLAMMAAIAAPRLNALYERQRLSGAAASLKLRWEEARLEALRSGQAQVFECVLEDRRFRIQPLVRASDATEAGVGAEMITAAGTVVETQPAGFLAPGDDLNGQWEELDDGLTFLSCQVLNDMRAYLAAQEAQSTGTGDVSTQTVANQVIFYPDGSTSTAEVQIRNQRGDVWGVRIRGLTGHTEVVRFQSVSEEDSG
ncbi:MAG: prepilin-type N-terminal cleavage/methylation domain-containing protein [Planctomycetota bacterium]|nr:MAG: prepilin-type N-terminal cleavage/methylation domain-containing protein [Planctomycetota bacterium]